MSRRPSIANGYPNRPGTRMLPPSYQPEPIPMFPVAHTNSFKNNRVAPPPPSHQSLEYPSSMISNNSRIPTDYRQVPMNSNYINQSYYPQNNYMGNGMQQYPEDGLGESTKPKSWLAQPLCLGLTRISGGILFGTMIFLGVGSIAGLIVSVVLYVQDVNTDPQWKILGMVVCSIMFLTVLVTLCIFIYCYKKGRIVDNNNNNNNNVNHMNNTNNRAVTPPYRQEHDLRHPFNYNRSPVPYGRMENFSAKSVEIGTVQVQDKLTNTENTISPLRPRDIQRGVWNGNNAYGGVMQRPMEPPKMTHRVIQALPNDIDQIPSKSRNPVMDVGPQTLVRIPGNRREHGGEKQPQYAPVDDSIRKQRKRKSVESIETIELPKKGKNKQRFKKVTVKHVKNTDGPDSVDDDFPTDHFYQ